MCGTSLTVTASGWWWRSNEVRAPSRGGCACHQRRSTPHAPPPRLHAGGSAELVLNQMLKHTAVQSRFSCNMVALVSALPQTLTLKDYLKHFLDFRWGQRGCAKRHKAPRLGGTSGVCQHTRARLHACHLSLQVWGRGAARGPRASARPAAPAPCGRVRGHHGALGRNCAHNTACCRCSGRVRAAPGCIWTQVRGVPCVRALVSCAAA